MTTGRTCRAADPTLGTLKWWGAARCGAPATHEGFWGDLCERCAELSRERARNPLTMINVMAGRARTEEEIARLIRPIVPEERLS